MIQIGAFRAWMKKKIKEHENEKIDDYHGTHSQAYEQAMEDVADYMGFSLDDKEWEKWSP